MGLAYNRKKNIKSCSKIQDIASNNLVDYFPLYACACVRVYMCIIIL